MTTNSMNRSTNMDNKILKLLFVPQIANVKLIMFCVSFLVFLFNTAFSQTAYFIDGYHGGIWGHYPPGVTQFMVDQLKKNPDWKINLEIEPETWDWIKDNTPEAYKEFKDIFADQSTKGRIEFVNPAYAQGYLWNITGESVIRQFEYGIRKTRQHFPNAVLNVYSVEEPCFTSALPGILKSFGFQYASLKNPNTCWGGYSRGFGGELVNWVGPDGTKITTVPRYEIEKLIPGNTSKTIASDNGPSYIKAAIEYGIAHPVGMCLQDAGRYYGPYLGKGAYSPTEYVIWRDYFENRTIKTPKQDWKFSQEDVLVSLVWGSQILQKIAQEVRSAENRIIMAEKLSSIAGAYKGFSWPQSSFDSAWRSLLLSEHHDCWITPYNKSRAGDHLNEPPRSLSTNEGTNSWADKVVQWTNKTKQTSDTITKQALAALSPENRNERTFIRVFNTLGVERTDIASSTLPDGWDTNRVRVLDGDNKEVSSQIVSRPASKDHNLLFLAEIPSIGYNTYRLEKVPAVSSIGSHISIQTDGTYKMETDLYILVLDPAHGGTIKSLKAKKSDNKEYVDATNARRFSEIRGFFYEEGKYYSSADQPAKLTILDNGPLQIRLQIEGSIGIHPFNQTITLVQAQKRIDFNLKINWQGNPGIGDSYSQTNGWRGGDNQKAFYDNRNKLLALFPLNLKNQKIYKNAPFDVTESKLDNTFFTTWDSIKNDLILNWVDAADDSNNYGLALLTDHTTSYAHGADHPLGLTLQYSGLGLWGKNYSISGASEINYALVPHSGKWNHAGIWTESDRWNEPLVASIMKANSISSTDRKSLISISRVGWEISAITREGNDFLVRIFNAEGDATSNRITFDGHSDKVEIVKLNGEKIRNLPQKEKAGKTIVSLSLPKLSVQTIRFINCSNLLR